MPNQAKERGKVENQKLAKKKREKKKERRKKKKLMPALSLGDISCETYESFIV